METYNSIEVTRQLVKDGKISQEIAETIFPELKESEDERIRKELIDFLDDVWHLGKNANFDKYRKADCIDWIAWLEKQGDYANFRNKIQIGDEVTRNPDGILVNLSQLKRLAQQGSQNLANSAKTCKVEQKPTLPGFEEQEGVAGRDYIPVEWVEAIENYGKWKIVRVNEQNPAWSKEDEENLNWFEKFFRAESVVAEGKDIPQDRYLWFKNLKERVQPQNTWKPSDEQMKALDEVYKTHSANNVCRRVLFNLMNDLQKLKG